MGCLFFHDTFWVSPESWKVRNCRYSHIYMRKWLINNFFAMNWFMYAGLLSSWTVNVVIHNITSSSPVSCDKTYEQYCKKSIVLCDEVLRDTVVSVICYRWQSIISYFLCQSPYKRRSTHCAMWEGDSDIHLWFKCLSPQLIWLLTKKGEVWNHNDLCHWQPAAV